MARYDAFLRSTAKPTHQIYRLLVRYPHLISRGRIIPKRGPLP